MKTYLIFLLLILSIETFAQYSSTTVKTPKGSNVLAGTFTGTDFTSTEKNDLKNYWLNYYNNQIIYRGEATKQYNCHAYAWHVSEGGDNEWVYSDDGNVNKYWNDTSYYEVNEQTTNLKVSYGGPCWNYSYEFNEYADWCDHSAVTTSQTNYFISKWGAVCLFEHHIDDSPYDPQDLHFYAISAPVISSTTSGILCNNVQRTFSETRFTDIDLDYQWYCTSPLSEVSGHDGSTYIVEGASQYGEGIISLVITTPSGATAYASKSVSVLSSHDVEVYCEGGDGGPTYQSYPLSVNPYYEGDNIVWGVYPTTAEITDINIDGYASICFYAQAHYNIWAYAENECGVGNPGYANFYAYDQYLLSPNPASDQITITVNKDKSGNVNSDKVYNVRILDMRGTLKGQGTFSGESFVIPVHNLKNGTFLVKINDGKSFVSKKLIIKH